MIETYPVAGNQCCQTAKITISSAPTQKAGRLKPMSARASTARPMAPPRRAENTPRPTPITTLTNSVPMSSDSVTGRRWPIAWATGWSVKIDCPRSPRTAWPSQFQYCS